MHYFSEKFLTDLITVKSKKFQDKFFEIIDGICSYFDTEEEKKDFQKYIEENHSYDKPGNLLYSTQMYFGRKQTDVEKLKNDLHVHLLGLFDHFDSADVMVEAPHIIICLATSNKEFTDADMDFLKNLINLERLCRGVSPAGVTTILNIRNDVTSCYVAALK